ncbi:expressed unknown protein [Seminavis robusta]|uniref:Uncharacterized protein n=1 Tax=Seminavis robusta TaxID=568900 RepID=A0A9N8DUE3_9STRA|nr:expressed unknown protein [Seminavis robusta]|eukprot:Sro283_g107660.1 n/a (695) ;mRNA; f:11457-14028
MKTSFSVKLVLVVALFLDWTAQVDGFWSKSLTKQLKAPKKEKEEKGAAKDEAKKKKEADMKRQKELEKQYLKYSEGIFIQSMARGKSWLTGGRSDKNKSVYVQDLTKKGEEKKHYTWRIIAGSVSGGKFHEKKKGTCVKYGDWVWLQVIGTKTWMRRGQNGVGSGLSHRDVPSTTSGDATRKYGDKIEDLYLWKITSVNPMSTNPAKDKDPSRGRCILDMSAVYFEQKRQVKGLSSWNFLSVPDTTHGVKIRTAGKGYEGLKGDQWILRRDEGQGGNTPRDAFTCEATAAESNWILIKSCAGCTDQTVSYEHGMTETKGKDYTKSKNWELSVSRTVEADLKVGSTSTEVGFSYGQEVSNTVSESLEFSKTETLDSNFERPYVWQFETEVTGICGGKTKFPSRHLAGTNSASEMPCCVPKYFLDAKDHPHGACKQGTPCFCDKDVCFPKPKPKPEKEEEKPKPEKEEEKPSKPSKPSKPIQKPSTKPGPLTPSKPVESESEEEEYKLPGRPSTPSKPVESESEEEEDEDVIPDWLLEKLILNYDEDCLEAMFVMLEETIAEAIYGAGSERKLQTYNTVINIGSGGGTGDMSNFPSQGGGQGGGRGGGQSRGKDLGDRVDRGGKIRGKDLGDLVGSGGKKDLGDLIDRGGKIGGKDLGDLLDRGGSTSGKRDGGCYMDPDLLAWGESVALEAIYTY